MVKFTVDGPARLLIAKVGVVEVDVQIDLYSDAKEDWIANEPLMKFPFPFRTVGGDPIGAGKFFGDGYFLTNGWKIRPYEIDHELTCTGNLFLDVTETGGIFVPTLGDFTVLATIERSADAIGIEVGGGAADWTTTEKNQIRHRLGLDGTAAAPGAVPSLATATSLATAQTRLDLLQKIATNRLEEAPGNPGILILYDDDNATPILNWTLRDHLGGATTGTTGASSKRTKAT